MISVSHFWLFIFHCTFKWFLLLCILPIGCLGLWKHSDWRQCQIPGLINHFQWKTHRLKHAVKLAWSIAGVLYTPVIQGWTEQVGAFSVFSHSLACRHSSFGERSCKIRDIIISYQASVYILNHLNLSLFFHCDPNVDYFFKTAQCSFIFNTFSTSQISSGTLRNPTWRLTCKYISDITALSKPIMPSDIMLGIILTNNENHGPNGFGCEFYI